MRSKIVEILLVVIIAIINGLKWLRRQFSLSMPTIDFEKLNALLMSGKGLINSEASLLSPGMNLKVNLVDDREHVTYTTSVNKETMERYEHLEILIPGNKTLRLYFTAGELTEYQHGDEPPEETPHLAGNDLDAVRGLLERVRAIVGVEL